MISLKNKYIFFSIDLSIPENGVKRVLRRINRESKTQFISDVQRVPARVKGSNDFNWGIYSNFHIIAKRFIKNKLFNDKAELTNYYGETTALIEDDLSSMLSDVPFEEMFNIVEGNNKNDIYNHIYNVENFAEIRKNKILKPFNVCIDSEGEIGKLLKKEFNIDVYVTDVLYDHINKKHFDYNYSKKDKYSRNSILHQVTKFGNDKKQISKEDNSKNSPIIMWIFKDKIVYKESSGHSEW